MHPSAVDRRGPEKGLWKLTRSKQVLFKRKPVQYLPRPVIEDDSSEVRITRVEFALALKSRTLDVG